MIMDASTISTVTVILLFIMLAAMTIGVAIYYRGDDR
ncbi:MAG: hypothetical protein GFH27_549285n147 [Chloroflexi bacterium AL-W]|nr:hypothetical protein [Chloroflexi bacterium AL-N1]NOK65659.1 hypothetical protein [Chloroflexi bacterium AL-N10]NOK74400.1 hypothetical protein [Chloroflexi bacterium AL-N5]NOK80692.1 hypothetical protein [Chloroflexi bacterium AL-W]NOK88658.1 hypothetical protein [Chloroflexi bacterium AL-N15]